MNYTIDQIQPLIVSAEEDGRTMICEFALPGSDEIFSAKGTIRKQRTVTTEVKRQVSRTLTNSLRRSASQLLRGLFGSNVVGRTASTAFNTATRGVGRNVGTGPSDADKDAAIVEAFQRVARNFHYDEASGKWSGPKTPAAPKEASPFAQQLKSNPVSSAFEKKLLGRMLAHLAYADGDVSSEEMDFFNSSIPAEVGTLESLKNSDPVSAVECESLGGGVRKTIYMIAWAISLMDLDIADAEAEMLASLGEKLGFTGSAADEIAKIAKFYVLDGYLDEDMPRSELFELGEKLGLSNDDAERAKIAWMKRQ
ncbi:MAG: TerB family tellurite resistance protein [Bacteroidia bacterium]|nr:TerB family tellurite resistance protein [Bacteroidia bacterium]